MTKRNNEGNKWLAKILAAHAYRNNTPIEDIHAGEWPKNAKGEWADPAEVIVITVDGGEKIRWDSCSRISDTEMKEMNKAVVDNIYSMMSLLEEFNAFPWTMNMRHNWDEAKHAPWYKQTRKQMLEARKAKA